MGGATASWFTAALDVPVDVGSVTVDGATIMFRAWGRRGDPGIVLVHGGAAHARWWDHIGPILAVGGKRVVALDLSGHGDSGRRETYDLDRWGREVMAVAEAADASELPLIVGHSMGGFVALRTIVTFPYSLAGVIVVDSPLRELSAEQVAAFADLPVPPNNVYPSRDAALRRFRPVPDQPVIDYIAAHIAEHSLRAERDGWTWKFDPRIVSRAFFAPSELDASENLRIALIRGERGLLTSDMVDSALRRNGHFFPDIEIPDAGHHIMLDQPLALVAALRTLIEAWGQPAHRTVAHPSGELAGRQ